MQVFYFSLLQFQLYLVIDAGAELNQQEAVGNHRKDTQD